MDLSLKYFIPIYSYLKCLFMTAFIGQLDNDIKFPLVHVITFIRHVKKVLPDYTLQFEIHVQCTCLI